MATKKEARIKLYAPRSTPSIGVGDEIHPVASDGTVEIPEWREAEFLAIGCTREPRGE
jgi:hypothetical protein